MADNQAAAAASKRQSGDRRQINGPLPAFLNGIDRRSGKDRRAARAD